MAATTFLPALIALLLTKFCSNAVGHVEIFDTLLEAKVPIERWRVEYNTRRPRSSLGYRPPAPETVLVDPSASAALQPPDPPTSQSLTVLT